VGPRQNGLSDGRLVPAFATRLFTALCGYRLVDIIALLGGTYPPATIVERSPAPTGTLQVCTFTALRWEELIFGLSVSLNSKTGFHCCPGSRVFSQRKRHPLGQPA
jgi:hypothetical protein